MHLGPPVIVRDGKSTEYRVDVRSSGGNGALWFRVAAPFDNLVSDLGEAALVGLLLPAMARGEDVHLAGPLSERLLYNVSGPYQALAQSMCPWLERVRIHAAGTLCGDASGSGVATGFSCGIDSHCVIADHFLGEVPSTYRLTHLVFFNVGSHGEGERGARLFEARHARVAPAAERLGLPLVKLDSNLGSWYEPFGNALDFDQTSTVRNVSAALVLQRGIRRYMLAGSVAYPDITAGLTHSNAYSDPIGMPMLSTDSLDAMSVGSEYTRVQKTLRVASIVQSHDNLDVCTDPDTAGNCSACWKCLRTMLTLDIAGLLPTYAAVFDLAAYARRRDRFLREVLVSDEPLYREIVQFARERGYAFPLSTRLLAHATSHAARAQAAIRRVAQSVRRRETANRPGGAPRATDRVLTR